jgi:hypothetical protein
MVDNYEGAAQNTTDSDPETLSSELIVTTKDLLAGDILLHRSQKPDPISNQISKTTNSQYTHASIYIGDGCIAESVVPNGVRKVDLLSGISSALCIGVLRTQCGFDSNRADTLNSFVDTVIENGRLYDFRNVVSFEKASERYFSDQLNFINLNYGKVKSSGDFAKEAYFCSSFVVACWAAVGVIGSSAQVAYEPKFFSPAGLYRDPTFGWLLGYLLPNGGSIPEDDPLQNELTLWKDQQTLRWW